MQESDDEWVEKGTNTSTTDTVKSLTVPSQPQVSHFLIEDKFRSTLLTKYFRQKCPNIKLPKF